MVKRFCRKGMQLSWTDPTEEMMDKKDDSYSNHRFLESNVKQSKKRKRKSCSCQLCGRMTTVKHPHTTEPHHPGPTCAYSHHCFEVCELKMQMFVAAHQLWVFAPNQSDVNRCLYYEERHFFSSDSDNL